MIRVRFAPSPTGFLHVGGARTALFNFFCARHNEGKLILRIEDTDVERSTKESEEQLMNSLMWLGITWDEGPDTGGPHGPYRQSERQDKYKDIVQRLLESGNAYEVYAYPEEIEAIKNKLLSEGKPPHYDEEMFSEFNNKERRDEFKMKGLSPVVFFKMPRKDYSIVDMVKGEVTFKKGALGDFVIMRSSGLPIYNFAVVVDDIDMEITHVIRGDDHLSNTLKQLVIYEALDVAPPVFAHVSMILGPDGKKLSKRHGATSVEEFKEKGFIPEAFTNYLSLLGWSHPDGKEIININEIIKTFTIERLHSSPAIFDENKARWMNGVYIRELSLERITELSKPFITRSGLLSEQEIETNEKWLKKAVDSVRKNAETLTDIAQKISIYIDEPDYRKITIEEDDEKRVSGALAAMKNNIDHIDDWSQSSIISAVKEAIRTKEPSKKDFYHNLRKVLTGKEEGPELIDIIYLLGRNEVIKRIDRAVNAI
ncbi:MAG: glutamate--tRNA ligase [Kosmotoga sp.]|nr:MAG: glutamate--tRNA ligase [Kosmotoga sp.]